MLNRFLFFLFLFITSFSISQTTVTVSDGSLEGPIPVYTYYGYSYGEVIYLQSEINSSGDIDQILLEWDGSVTESRSWKIFMGHTSKVSYSSTSDRVGSSGLTQVYDGTVSLAGIGSYFVPISLDTNFSYNNSDNLIIAIQDNTNSYTGSTSRFLSQAASDGNSRTIVKYTDSGVISTTTPPTANSRYAYTPSLKIRITASSPAISVGSSITGLNYANGSGPSTSQSTTVSGSNLQANISLTAPTNFEISTDNSSFSGSVTLSHSGGTVNSTTIYARLKTGLANNSYSGNITASSTNATSQTISLSGQVSSTDIYVDDSGDDSNDGLSASSPFATLDQAISSAADGVGVTINVGAGTYTEHTVNVNKTNLTITGAGSSSTIFESNTANKGFMSITASDVTVENMKIKDYNFTSASSSSNAYGGAAIRVGSTPGNTSVSSTISGVSIKNIIFKDNYTDADSGDGGAIELQSHASPYSTTTTVTIDGCIFDGNKAGLDGSEVSGHNGGAIQGKIGAHLTINNSVFYDNDADYTGAAVNIWSEEPDIEATITMNNCTLYDNTAFTDDSGKIAQFYVTGDVTADINNSIIYGANIGNNNSFDVDGQDGHWFYGSDYYVTTINMRNSVIGDYSTTEFDYTVSNVTEGSDPLFNSTANDDYTLQDNSPAVDNGSASYAPSDDINSLSRPQGQADDIGAYERRNSWIGGATGNETNWGTAANWSENIVPVSGRSPIIADVINQPVISSDDGSSGNVTLKDITINSGAVLTIT